MKKNDVLEFIALPIIVLIYVFAVSWILLEGAMDTIRERIKRKKK